MSSRRSWAQLLKIRLLLGSQWYVQDVLSLSIEDPILLKSGGDLLLRHFRQTAHQRQESLRY